jgi:hypothetical protein
MERRYNIRLSGEHEAPTGKIVSFTATAYKYVDREGWYFHMIGDYVPSETYGPVDCPDPTSILLDFQTEFFEHHKIVLPGY